MYIIAFEYPNKKVGNHSNRGYMLNVKPKFHMIGFVRT